MLGDLLRDFQAWFSPISIADDTVRQWRRRRQSCPLTFRRFSVCAVSRHGYFIGTDCTRTWSRNGANRKRLAICPFQPLAVALLRLFAPVTKHTCSLDHSPKAKCRRRATLGGRHARVAASQQMRGPGLQTRGETSRTQYPRSCVSAFRLRREFRGTSVLCRWLQIVQERDRGRR